MYEAIKKKQAIEKYSANSNMTVSQLKCRQKSPFSFLYFLFLLCFLIFISCDLFTGPKVDLFQQISDEVDWASAPKLSVRIDYPPAWGVSNPPQGNITQVIDIRKGYEFSVEFTPDMAYTLQSWQVYLTEDLDNLTDGSWVESPELINDANKIQSLGPDKVKTPETNASGGIFKFTIWTTEPVTLVPLCDTQPRITRTEPRNRPGDCRKIYVITTPFYN